MTSVASRFSMTTPRRRSIAPAGCPDSSASPAPAWYPTYCCWPGSTDFATRGGAAEAHEAARGRAPSLFNRIIRRFVAEQEFLTSERRQFQRAPQLVAAIADHAKDIRNLAVQIIVDLGVTAWLAHEHATPAAERLDVNPVRREVRDNPICKKKLPTMISHDRARYGVHLRPPRIRQARAARMASPVRLVKINISIPSVCTSVSRTWP